MTANLDVIDEKSNTTSLYEKRRLKHLKSNSSGEMNFLYRFAIEIKDVSMETEKRKKKYVSYMITVTHLISEYQFIVYRRYSNFVTLRQKLVQSGYKVGDLPPKRILFNLSPEHIENRRIQLNRWLQELLLNDDLKKDKNLISFLGITNRDNCEGEGKNGLESFEWIRRTGGGMRIGIGYNSSRQSPNM